MPGKINQLSASDSLFSFKTRLDEMNEGLNQGKWLNDKCIGQSKNYRVIRILKAIVGLVFGDMFSHVRINNVVNNFFVLYQNNHRAYNTSDETKDKALKILNNLNSKTKNTKYYDHIEIVRQAILNLHSASTTTVVIERQVPVFIPTPAPIAIQTPPAPPAPPTKDDLAKVAQKRKQEEAQKEVELKTEPIRGKKPEIQALPIADQKTIQDGLKNLKKVTSEKETQKKDEPKTDFRSLLKKTEK